MLAHEQKVLAVDPKYNGLGIGSQLLAWGTTQAERDGVPCWLEATDEVRPSTPRFPTSLAPIGHLADVGTGVRANRVGCCMIGEGGRSSRGVRWTMMRSRAAS